MDRDEFMELVYETFADEPDNVLANGIIEAADAYVEHEKAQLFLESTTSDLISRQAAIRWVKTECNPYGKPTLDFESGKKVIEHLEQMPPAQPEPQEGRFERKRDGVFCSVCHYGWEFITGVPAEVEREYHYCPNCGARMTISTK